MYSLLQTLIPATFFALSIVLFCLAASTPQRLRWLPQIPLLILIYLSFANSHRWPAPIDSLWGMMMTVWISHSTSILWFVDWQTWWKDEGQCAGEARLCVCEKHRRIWRLWNNPRLVGTPIEVRGVPNTVTEISKLVLARAGKLLAYWILWHYIQPLIFPGLFMPIQVSEFGVEYESIVRRLILSGFGPPVAAREVGMRSVWAILWASGAAVLIDAAHAMLSILCVAIFKIDEPTDWPPMFGSILEAYSIRRFWGHFWHKIIVQPYTQFGKLYSRKILRLSPRSGGDKVCVVFIIFLLSGVAHAAVGYQLGDRCGWVQDIVWFCSNAIAGAGELFATALLQRLAKRTGIRLQYRALSTAVGFAWVFLFFFWSVPKWQYPKLRCAIEQEIARSRIAAN